MHLPANEEKLIKQKASGLLQKRAREEKPKEKLVPEAYSRHSTVASWKRDLERNLGQLKCTSALPTVTKGDIQAVEELFRSKLPLKIRLKWHCESPSQSFYILRKKYRKKLSFFNSILTSSQMTSSAVILRARTHRQGQRNIARDSKEICIFAHTIESS